MPRSNRPRSKRVQRSDRDVPDRELPDRDVQRPLLGGQREERAADGTWHVRPVSGAAALKEYRCPGCRQVIAPGTPHILAWPSSCGSGSSGGGTGGFVAPEDAVAARRHWHSACWSRRTRLPAR